MSKRAVAPVSHADYILYHCMPNEIFLSLGGTSSENTLHFAGRHQFKIASSLGINLQCTASVVLVQGALDEGVFNKTLSCSVVEDQCLTGSGDVFPAKCVFPFVHNGREFHACTDIGSSNPSRYYIYIFRLHSYLQNLPSGSGVRRKLTTLVLLSKEVLAYATPSAANALDLQFLETPPPDRAATTA